MNTFVLESEDFDFLMSEECQMFMYEAAPQVKKSFLKRTIDKIKEMFRKIRNFVSSSSAKQQAEKLKNAVDENPEFAQQRIQMEDYESSYKLGKSALKKLEKAKTKEEAERILVEYQRQRKTRKNIAVTVGALATLVVGGTLFKRASARMLELEKELPKLREEYRNADEIYDAVSKQTMYNVDNTSNYLGNLLRRSGTTPEEYAAASKIASNIYDRENKRLKSYKNVYDAKKKAFDECQAQCASGIIGLMAQDLRDQVMKPFQLIKKNISSKGSKK